MDFKLSSLKIECVDTSVLIPFSSGITHFYGNAAVGKTTLLNLINYTLGQNFKQPQIVEDEVRRVSLDAYVCGKRLVIERSVPSNLISVKDDNQTYSFSAKGTTAHKESFSDFLYRLAGLTPSEFFMGKNANPVKASFANYMWYSYLRQDELDNTLFYLEDTNANIKRFASNHVLRLMLDESEAGRMAMIRSLNDAREQKMQIRRCLEAMSEIFQVSPLFKVNIEDEIKRKETLLSRNDWAIRESEGRRDFDALIKLSRTAGKYEAEIRYLKEFSKISRLKSHYEEKLSMSNSTIRQVSEELTENRNEFLTNSLSKLSGIFQNALLNVGFPDFTERDLVKINSKSFLPTIHTPTKEFRYDFFNLSSSGIRTIFKICYALSIHQLMSGRLSGTLLPTFILIDTPMKNISERIDCDIFNHLYQYFYRLFSMNGPLKNWQLITVDKELPEVFQNGDVLIRRFSNNSPLIPRSTFDGERSVKLRR